VLGAVAVGILWAWQAGVYSDFSLESLQQNVSEAGPLGAALFIPAWTLAVILHLPAILFPFAAGLLWPVPVALGISWLGGWCAGMGLFVIARFTVRDAAQQRIPVRFRGLEERLADGGVRGVVLFRLVTFVGSGFQWFLGASRVSMRDVALGTAIGIIPWICVLVALGGSEISWAARLAGIAAVSFVSISLIVRSAIRAERTS